MSILQVFVASDCYGCEEAIRLAGLIAQRFAALTVEIIDLDEKGAVRPDGIFATPTYVLNGQVIALGNPREIEFKEWITDLVSPTRRSSASRSETDSEYTLCTSESPTPFSTPRGSDETNSRDGFGSTQLVANRGAEETIAGRENLGVGGVGGMESNPNE